MGFYKNVYEFIEIYANFLSYPIFYEYYRSQNSEKYFFGQKN